MWSHMRGALSVLTAAAPIPHICQVSSQIGEEAIPQGRGSVWTSSAFHTTAVPPTQQGHHSIPPLVLPEYPLSSGPVLVGDSDNLVWSVFGGAVLALCRVIGPPRSQGRLSGRGHTGAHSSHFWIVC